ncbi:beta-carotene hydroxylase B1 [Canna indica]|uniref:beta-carotene 3-hydroxylase n=1 Tax=Canna indica TaxID=4628 RepID=A0AAQ3K2V6_9LILI|nr:beta-carotene hydroxylase B1 [Canna indica]
MRKESERRTYLIAVVMSSVDITSMAIASVYYRFSWQMERLRGLSYFTGAENKDE